MRKIKPLLLIIITSLTIQKVLPEEVINVPTSALSSETKTMDFLIDNYFNERDIENPKVRKKVEQRIKKLNSHIINWNYLKDSTQIMYEKKSPVYELSLGSGTSYFEDDNISSSSNYLNMLFNLNYYLTYQYFAFLNLKYSQYNHQAKDAPDFTFEKSQTIGYELGVTQILKNPYWQMSLSLQKDRIGTLSSILAEPGARYSEEALYRDVVKNSQLNFLWLNSGLEYFFTLFKTAKTGSVQFIYGYALSGTLKADEYEKTEVISAHKLDMNYKQFFYNNIWGKLNIHQTLLYSTLNLSNFSFDVSLGISI